MNYAKIPVPNIGRMLLWQCAAILFALLLAIAIWMNRPPTLFINKTTNGQKKIVQYQICVIQHRWGRQVICFGPGDYQKTEFQLFMFNKNMQSASFRQRWQTTLPH